MTERLTSQKTTFRRIPAVTGPLNDKAQVVAPKITRKLVEERVDIRSIVSNIISTLLLRIASRLSFILLSFYLGERFTSAAVVALVLESFYISELLLAPIVGSLSDHKGRKPFLLAAPMLGAGAALCLLLGALFFPSPNVHLLDARLLGLLGLILVGRLLEGAATALNTPASLGYIADTTSRSEQLRARVMTAFEVVTVGGLALAIPFGGKISSVLGMWGFCLVILLHLVNILLITCFVKESTQSVPQANRHGSLLESLTLLRYKPIFTFLPAWLAINSLVGAWITLIILMLTYPNPAANLRFPDQLFYGGFSKEFATQLVGGFCLLFLLGMGVWTFILPRLRRTTVMFIGLGGLVICIGALTIINGMAGDPDSLVGTPGIVVLALIPWVALGILLLSGFTPAALTHLAALSEILPGKRGAVMGLYSVVLGMGQLLGASVGGAFVDMGGFYGLMIFSSLLGLLSLVSVLYIRMHGHDLLKSHAI